MNNKTLSAVTLGAFIIALAVGLIVYSVTDYDWKMIIWITLLIFGIALFALSFLSSSEPGKFGPSDSSYRMIMGILAATIGAVGLLNTLTNLSIWVLIAIFLIVLALVGISVALMNGKKEGK